MDVTLVVTVQENDEDGVTPIPNGVAAVLHDLMCDVTKHDYDDLGWRVTRVTLKDGV